MLHTYLPALVFLILGALVGTLFATLNTLVGVRTRANRDRTAPYECGLPSEVRRGFRFGISFYLIAMLFILFDIEVIFLSRSLCSCARSARSRWARRSHSCCC